ncbi:MAG: hypothetical protein U0353_10400 [Sandaracinus sp.]
MHRLALASAPLLIASSLALTAWPSLARADAIPPPPEECPLGTTPHSSHAGPSCVATLCGQSASPTTPIACPEGTHCAQAQLRYPPSTFDPRRPGFPVLAAVEGRCACPTPHCVEAEACVPDGLEVERCATAPEATDSAGRASQGGCASCAAARLPLSSTGTLTLTLLALAILARHTRRASPATEGAPR